MKHIQTFCLLVLLFAAQFVHGATYSWNAQVAGSLSYTTGNMSVSISNTNFNTLGPQNPNGGSAGGYQSPKYVSAGTINTYQGGFTNDYGMPGLVLGVDWPNAGQTIVLTITFATPVAGPVSFNIYDINRGAWGGYDPVFIDQVTVSATDCSGASVMPVITGCATNQVTGAGNQVIGSHGCTNNTNTVTFNSPGIKTITLLYTSGVGLAAGFGSNPDPQYIIISDITTGNNIPAAISASAPNITCTGSSTLTVTPVMFGAQYVWSDNSTSSSLTTGNPGTYSVTVTVNGCSATATTTIGTDTVKPVVNVTPASTAITCVMLGSALTAQSATPNLKYLWSDGDTIQVNMGNVPGVYTVTVTNPANGCTASASATVSVDTTTPDGHILPPDTLSCTNPTVTLTATSTTPNVIFLWPNGLGQGASKTISAPGMYYVLVKIISNGCTTSDTVFVAQSSSAPDAGITPPGSLNCINTLVTLQAANITQPYTYTWNTGATGTSLNVTQPGVYTLIVNDAGTGCADTSSVTVSQNTTTPAVQVTPASAVLNCSVASATLTATSTPANATFVWNSAQTTAAIQAATPGTYTVTATDPANGCTAVASATVTQTSTPPSLSIQSSGNIDCTNTGVILTTVTASPNLLYTWNTGGTASTNTVYTAGTYSVTVTDTLSGCINSDVITVTASATAVTVNINTPVPLTCAVTQATLTATATNATGFVWSTAETTSAISVMQPGVYTVTASNGAGCTATASVTVTQNIQAPTVAILTPDTLTCAVTSVQLTAGALPAGVAYLWNGGEQTAGITVNTGGAYSLTVTDNANGCTAIANTQVVQVLNAPVVTVNDAQLSCFASVVALTATTGSNVSYTWSNSEAGNVINVTQAGIYTVTVTDVANGCTATAQGTVAENTSVLSLNVFSSGVLTEETTGVILTTNTNAAVPVYSWSTGETTPHITVSEAGGYTVTVTDNSTGCSGAVFISVTENLSNHVFVPNVFTPNGDGNNDVFHIYGNLKGIAFLEVQVFNRWGEKVFESNDHYFGWDGTYKGTLQNPAVYVWQLKLVFSNGQTDELRKGTVTLLK